LKRISENNYGSSKGKFARSKGRTINQCLALVPIGMLASGLAFASPQGGNIVGGIGTIQQPGATQTIIDQQTQKLAIDWQSFNLAAGESVRFNQPSVSASVLNRILDQNPSQILGSITANGRVFLANPNGIIFGKSSTVNVGSLVATTLKANVNDFMLDGAYKLGDVGLSAGGVIVNRGLIAASTGGSVTLVGGSVLNEGIIQATAGYVNLASGRTAVLDFDGDGLLSFTVDGEVMENTSGARDAVANSGTILADGGQVLLSGKAAQDVFTKVVNNEGIIQANTIDNSGGVIRLIGGETGIVANSGSLVANGNDAGENGGTVQMLGEKVGLLDYGKIEVTGDADGGVALVGGDYQGKNSDVQNADMTYVGQDAVIDASSTGNGDGGKVIVWADDTTRYYGNIAARGGNQGGDGGFVEVSGKGVLDFQGMVDTSAPMGMNGRLLLDPTEITISDDAERHIEGTDIFTSTGNNSVLNVTTLNEQLFLSSVTVLATDDIDVEAITHIDLQGNGLTLTSSAGGITFDANTVVADTFGGGNLDLNFTTLLDLSADPNFSAVTTVTANGGGVGTIMGSGRTYTMNATLANAGSSDGITWTGVSNLFDTGAGTFISVGEGSISGSVSATNGTIDYSGHTGAVTFDLANGSGETTGVGTTWSGITTVTGSSNSDTVKGGAVTFAMDAVTGDAGSSSGISWTSFENLLSSGAGTFATGAAGSVSGSIAAVGGTLDYTNHSGAVSFDLANSSGETTGVGMTWSGITTVTGSSNSDTVKGSGATYNLTSASAGNNGTTNWTSFELVTDTGSGTISTTGGQTYNLTGTGVGSVTTLLPAGFTGIANLIDSGAGTFTTGAAGSVSGSITAVGGTLDYTDHTGSVSFDLANSSGETTGVGTTWSGITTVTGSSNSDTVKGSGATYNLTSASAGNNGTTNWTSFELVTDTGSGTISTTGGQTYNLTGTGTGSVTALLPTGFTGIANLIDSGAGTFTIGATGSVSGSITAAGGTLDYTGHTGAVTFDLANGWGETTGVGTTWSGITTVTGSSNSDTVKGSGATYNLTSANAGNNGTTNWTSFELVTDTGSGTISTTGGQTYNLTGTGVGSVTTLLPAGFTGIANLIDSGAGTFKTGAAGSVSGSITAVGGTLDYTGHTGAVTFDLANGSGETTGVGTTWSGITTVTGSSNSDTVKGGAVTFAMDAVTGDAGTSSGISWTSFENLLSSGSGTFTTGAAGSVSGSITAIGGTLDYTGHTGAVTFDLANGWGETTGVGAIWSGITTVTGSSNSDTAKGSGATYNLTSASAGNNGTTNWTSFERVTDTGSGTISTTGGQTYNLTGTGTGSVTALLPTGFTGIANLIDSGAGTFATGATGSVSGSITAAGGTLDYTGHTGAVTFDLANGWGETTGVGTTWSGITTVTGSSNSDTVKGGAVTFAMDDVTGNAGSSSGISWTSFENLLSSGAGSFKTGAAGSVSGSITAVGGTLDYTGHSGAVTFDLANGMGETIGVGTTRSGITAVIGSSNSDTVKGGAVTFAMDSATSNAGSSGGVSWTSFENLFSSGAGIFTTGAAGSVFGSITSTGGTLDYTGHTATVEINRQTASATGIGGTFSGIASVVGNDTSGTLIGINAGETFTVTGANTGTAGSLTFLRVGNLVGGIGNDNFILQAGGTLTGNVIGGTQSIKDTLNLSAKTGVVSINQETATATGIGGTFSGIEAVVGNGTITTLTGLNSGETFDIIAANAGIAGSLTFAGVANLNGGTGDNIFNGAGGSLSGSLIVGNGATTTLTGELNIGLIDLNSHDITINGNINAGQGGVRLEALSGDITNPGHWINTTGNLDVKTPGWVNLNLKMVSKDVSIIANDYPVNILNGLILGKTTVRSYFTGQTISFANPFLNSILSALNGNEMNVGYYIDPALFNVNLALFTTKDPGLLWPDDQLEEILSRHRIPTWYNMVENTWPATGYGNSRHVAVSL
jgi:filamentous hemagglutinin family protein